MEDCSRGNGLRSLRMATPAHKHQFQGSPGGPTRTLHPWHRLTGEGSATARLGRCRSHASPPSRLPSSETTLIINKHQRSCPAESTAGPSAAGHQPRAQAQQPWAGQGWESNACRESWRRGTGNPRHPAWDEVGSLTCWQPVESRRAPAPRRDHALHPLGLGRVVEAEEGGLAQADGAPWGEGEERAQPPAATPERCRREVRQERRQALPGPAMRPQEGSGLLPSAAA